jgi:hypothetical protein
VPKGLQIHMICDNCEDHGVLSRAVV